MKAFIFDLDGTLIDSLADLAEAVNRMLAANGYPTAPLSVFPRYIGDGVKALVSRALPAEALEREDIDARVAEYQAHYADTWRDKTVPYPGVLETLHELQTRGANLAVLSNKPHRFTLLCTQHFFPSIAFASVLGARDGVPRKPDPAGALEIAATLGLAVAECAYIGDSGIDMETATRAGMRPIGVNWGFRSVDELRSHGAREIISHPQDLLHLTPFEA